MPHPPADLPPTPPRLLTLDDALAYRRTLAVAGGRLVLTNGVFDLLHAGHVASLAAARALGDALLVGLNDDDSVRALRGPGRPLQPLADRAEVLLALRGVDGVVPFAGPTAEGLVAALRPEVYVKGSDYALPGADDGKAWPEAVLVLGYGGQVHRLPTLPGRSTTNLIARIRALPAP